MSIRYDLYETPDIQQTGEQQPLHPRVVINGTVDQNEFLDRVHKFTGISRSLLSGAMQSFQNELRDLLANGCGTGGYRLLFRFSTRPSHHEERRGTRTIYQTEEYQFPPKRSIQKGSGLANEIGTRRVFHPSAWKRTQ